VRRLPLALSVCRPNLIMFKRLSLLLVLVCASAFAQTPVTDPCELRLPGSLREVLKVKFFGYRLAQLSDYDKESSGIGFFYTGKHWVHLWLSD
jgi:hypothetical protein